MTEDHERPCRWCRRPVEDYVPAVGWLTDICNACFFGTIDRGKQ